MSPKILFGTAMTVLIVGMLFAVFTLLKTGREFSGMISNRSSSWNLDSLESNKGLFAVKKVSYSLSAPVNCSDSPAASVSIEFILRPKSLTKGCELYTDYKFEKEIRTALYECPSCSSTDYVAVAVSTKPIETSKSHIVEVCCDETCVEKSIPAIC